MEKNSSAGTDVTKWADPAMYAAQPIDVPDGGGPIVALLSMNPDPLGSIAAAALAYTGRFVSSLAEITDDERRYYLREVQKTALAMPLETVQFHFVLSGVSRSFTHQLVRQRTAAYAQESLRFAVKDGENLPVGLPPSLVGADPAEFGANYQEYLEMHDYDGMGPERRAELLEEAYQYAEAHTSREGVWRRDWDQAIENIGAAYDRLINTGMPAEDARGLLPMNVLTRVNYITNLRGLKDHSGLRLCTQAQAEWRDVWSGIIAAIRGFGRGVGENAWQFDALADVFRPICYYEGKCAFAADFDRACPIRDRVNALAAAGVPSTEWDHENVGRYGLRIDPIRDEEWRARGARGTGARK